MSAFAVVAYLVSCGRGPEIDLGDVSSGGDAGQGGASACGALPCANHTGEKSFLAGTAPEDARDLFQGAVRRAAGEDPAREPVLEYPSHETMFPINVSGILHEWSSRGDDALYELTFTGPRTRVTVYTDELRFTPSDEQWDWIAESNRGRSVELTVAALDATGVDVWTSNSTTLHFSAADVEGAIYYWSTAAEGVMRALIGDATPIKFYAEPSGTEKAPCVGCHTLSRDGKRLAVGYEGERLREVAVSDRSVILPVASGAGGGGPGGMDKGESKAAEIASAWTTFSPDGRLLLVAANGTLTLIDSDTGEPVGEQGGVVPTPAGAIATHPDWAAAGDRVAFTLAEKGGNKEVERGAIATLSYRDGVWGEAEIVVPNAGDLDNNFFPVFSPDGRWIAFVNAQGKSKDAPSAAIRLVRVSDGRIVELSRLNQRVGPVELTNVGNSMPTWAPSTRAGVFWLAFSSLRAYATVRPADPQNDQIWVAAIDTSQPDPSYAAFWAPFQNVEHGNHRAFWTHTSEDRQCGCEDICGDAIDNDCDGSADEAGCLESCTAREVCGDGVDNDCNCVIDDCTTEVCDDGIDNDGDELADAMDPSCAGP